MRKTASFIALIGSSTLLLTGIAHADYASVQEKYVSGAFSEADDDWRRIMINRNDACGSYGKNGTRRIDVLIDDYEALGKAISQGNEATATKAAKELASSIERNQRFKSCWRKISRKNGITTSFTVALKKL